MNIYFYAFFTGNLSLLKRSLSTIATPKRTDYVLIATKNHHETKFGLLKKKLNSKSVFFSGLTT